jgi:hypothetical protein
MRTALLDRLLHQSRIINIDGPHTGYKILKKEVQLPSLRGEKIVYNKVWNSISKSTGKLFVIKRGILYGTAHNIDNFKYFYRFSIKKGN